MYEILSDAVDDFMLVEPGVLQDIGKAMKDKLFTFQFSFLPN